MNVRRPCTPCFRLFGVGGLEVLHLACKILSRATWELRVFAAFPASGFSATVG